MQRLKNELLELSKGTTAVDVVDRVKIIEEKLEEVEELKSYLQTLDETLEVLRDRVSMLMRDNACHKGNIGEAVLSIAQLQPDYFRTLAYTKARTAIVRDYGLVRNEGGSGFRPARPTDI